MKKISDTILKNIGFSAFLFGLLFSTNSFAAYSDAECFGTTDGTTSISATLSLVNSVDDVVEGISVPDVSIFYQSVPGNSYSNITNPDGIIKCTSTSSCNLTEMKSSPSSREALDNQLNQYLAGQRWSVTFAGKGTVSGYAYCGPNGWGSSSDKTIKNGAPATTYAGCGCTVTDMFDHSVSTSSFRFVTHKETFSGSDWLDKSNNCRTHCPAICANRVATESAFRQKLFTECPVFETGGGTGSEDTPTQIHCDAGTYLPMGATTCQTCDGTNNYCDGGDFYQNDTQVQGIAECSYGYEPNSEKTACLPIVVICEAGTYLPATKLDCEPCTGNNYCEEDIYDYSTTENQGLKTCAKGYVPNSTHTACEAKSIHCNDGYYLPKNSLTCAACIGFDYCTDNSYEFSATNDQGKNTCPYGTLPNENHFACTEVSITCPAGKYLPSNSSNEDDCQYCPDPYEVGEYYYCPGGTFAAHAQTDDGLQVCPEYAHSEEGSEYCTCNEGYTTDGKPENSTNKTTTTTECIPEGSAIYSASYYCDINSESLGSATISGGALFTLIDNIDFDDKPLCEKDGYNFGGWRDDFGNEYSAGDAFTWNYDTDVKFTAIWNQIPSYTVSYSCGNDATGGNAPTADSVLYGAQYTTRANTCEKTGYNFLGWVYNDDDLYESGETFTYNYNTSITLVPLWEGITITCQPGFWADGNATVCNSQCLVGHYCGGETYTFDGQPHGMTNCTDAQNYQEWGWTHGVTSAKGSTSVNDCKIVIAPATYMDIEGNLQQCPADHFCPGHTYEYIESDTFFNDLMNLGAGIYACPENTTSGSGETSCHCSNGYVFNTNTGTCVSECGAGLYLPANADSCTEVGAGYYSPNGDSARYQCPAGLTTSGSGIGADEYSDCGRVLHIGSETLRMRGVRKTIPSLNVKIGNTIYYGDMSVLPTNINANTNKTLRVKYDNVVQFVHDTTIE